MEKKEKKKKSQKLNVIVFEKVKTSFSTLLNNFIHFSLKKKKKKSKLYFYFISYQSTFISKFLILTLLNQNFDFATTISSNFSSPNIDV